MRLTSRTIGFRTIHGIDWVDLSDLIEVRPERDHPWVPSRNFAEAVRFVHVNGEALASMGIGDLDVLICRIRIANPAVELHGQWGRRVG